MALAGLVRACHPEPTAAVTVGSALLAVASGRPVAGVLAVAAAVLATQLCTGWHNDWLDASRDALVGRSDKPIPSGLVPRRAVGLAALVAGLAAVPLALLSGVVAGLVLLGALGSALLYNWPLKFTVLSPVPYAVSFGALPAYIMLGAGVTPALWLVAAGACLGVGAHFANVIPDLADDARTGVRGLPHRIGATRSAVAAAVGLGAASALLVLGPAGPPSWLALTGLVTAASLLLIGGYAQVRRPGSRVLFRVVLVVAVLDVALLVAAVGGSA
ncbi:UbiA family prenyltransferase [Luedemannella flava]|uniref:UbiA family prenyltransferase n=1 Tax=Luedemannella flava TaxID=349316 RepID=A0ABN2MGQ9_9ACTN